MSEITLDAATAATVAKALPATRVCDPSGHTLGYLVPADVYKRVEKALYDEAFGEMTDDEVQEVLADPRRHTTDEVLKLLEGN